LLPHKVSDRTLGASSGFDNSVGHRYNSHLNVDDLRLSFSKSSKSLSLHGLELIKASIESMKLSSTFLSLAGLHSLSHILSESSNVSLSSFLNSSKHHFTRFRNSGQSLLVSGLHLLSEGSSMLSGSFRVILSVLLGGNSRKVVRKEVLILS